MIFAWVILLSAFRKVVFLIVSAAFIDLEFFCKELSSVKIWNNGHFHCWQMPVMLGCLASTHSSACSSEVLIKKKKK